MTNYIFTRTICLLVVLFLVTQTKAGEGKPVTAILLVNQPSYALADTVPALKKPVEDKPTEDKPATVNTPVIKVVPKARKQIKPVALPNVTPVKIIKPVIKRIGSLIP